MDMERLNRLTVREQQMKQLMDRFNALMSKGTGALLMTRSRKKVTFARALPWRPPPFLVRN